MSDMITTLAFYMRFPFVRYALIVGVLIALCSSLLGVTLVLKRFSYIGDGLSHVAFGAMAVAAVLNLTNDTLLVMPVTVVAAILLLRTGQNTKIHGCVRNAVWFNVHSVTDDSRGMAVCSGFGRGDINICFLL